MTVRHLVACGVELEVPSGWTDAAGGKRLVLHGPAGEEIIVSGANVLGAGDDAEFHSVYRQLVQGAVTAMSSAAADPELTITKPLARSAEQSLVRWTLEAVSTDGSVLFHQAVIEGPRSAVLATFEAPTRHATAEVFAKFLDAIRPVAPVAPTATEA